MTAATTTNYPRTVLGLPEMDTQHAYLYDLFDRLIVSQSRDEIQALLDEIDGMLDFHFTSEEQLIRHYKVPGFAEHQTDHEQAANAFLKGVDAFEREQLNPAHLRASLTGWLTEHSQGADMKYAALIRGRRQQAGWCKYEEGAGTTTQSASA